MTLARLLLRVLLVAPALAAALAAAAHGYLQHPKFGTVPAGEHLAAIARSPNYAEGAFRNQLPSPLYTGLPWTNGAVDGTTIYGAADIPEIDHLLITHDHWDHLDHPTVAALEPKVRNVVAPLGVGGFCGKCPH